MVVFFCQLYIELKVKYRSQLDSRWPPPKYEGPLDELEAYVFCPSNWFWTLTLFYSTTRRIHELMGRKSEKSLAKRVLLGCFGIRDLGKVNKYQQKLGAVALRLQVTTQLRRPVYSAPHVPLMDYQDKPHNVNLLAVLQAVVHSRVQPQDEDSDSEFAGELVEGGLPNKKDKKKKAGDMKPTAGRSFLWEMGKSISVKPTNQRVKFEEDSLRESNKATVNISRTSSRSLLTNGPE